MQIQDKIIRAYFKAVCDHIVTGEEWVMFRPRKAGKVKLILRPYDLKMTNKQMEANGITLKKALRGKLDIAWDGYQPHDIPIKFKVKPGFDLNRKIRKISEEEIYKFEDRT